VTKKSQTPVQAETQTQMQTYQLTVLTAKGKKSRQVLPPTQLPSDLVPGEFVMIPDQQGKNQWYVFCDKQRWWGNGQWNVTGSVSPFDNSTMPEAQMYKLRRTLLKRFGWIG
jgi:hypothetical protein